jgi:negative regulator of sigma E activity
LGVTPEQIKGMQASLEKTVKEKDAVIGENKLLAAKVHDWENRWNNYFNSGAPVVLPAGLRGKIVAVDPKYNFVVLNIGDDQGVLERGEMLVDRDGKLLGKVRIVSVKKDECVANILPEWKQGEIVEGDEVLY